MLEIRNLNVDLARLRILHDISLEVGDREIVAVIGSNGAGKSTLLRAISGLTPARSGQVLLNGKDITRLSPDRIVQAGMSQIPERGRIFPYLSCAENLELGAWIQGNNRKAIAEDLAKVYTFFPILKERVKQKAGTLSGGERQMLAIGRALMSRPHILLLDEPTLGLAPLVCLQLGDIIKALNQLGTAVMLVEQNATLALSISRRAYVLELGRVVLSGASEELSRNDAVRKAYLGLE
jgi:branched-chain amino acid transport system ATP-binding protein